MATQTTSDPRTAGPRPPFDERRQDSPGLESEMRTKPDFGEDSYVGFGRMMGRRALITGGDSGIGRAVALAFAREGADVAFTHLPSEQPDAEETARVVRAAGRKAVPITADLADPEECARVVREAAKALGGIDVLVNNAAHQGRGVESIESLDPERVLQTFRVNIIAMFHLVREALPHLPPGAAVINVSSVQAYQPSASILDYAATKGAIVTFTKGLAGELIERGIRVNCVAPGPVWTPLIPQSFGGDSLRKNGAGSPMKRPAQPAELAPAFVFLACDEGRYVNGEILGVTGGELLA
ncbi:MAG: SDR family oxidoreductase [Myxococcota bacterium]|nr:SDR family oxidoreductase [Myxococcota bacterium]